VWDDHLIRCIVKIVLHAQVLLVPLFCKLALHPDHCLGQWWGEPEYWSFYIIQSLAAFIGDYPEQLLIILGLNGDYPRCPKDCNDLREYNDNIEINASLQDLDKVFNALNTFDIDASQFLQACVSIRIKPMLRPFWLKLPFLNTYCSITSDILHQMYQGFMKQIIQWVITIVDTTEIDACCRHMPPNHNMRVFTQGISLLSRVTGPLARNMTRCVDFF